LILIQIAQRVEKEFKKNSVVISFKIHFQMQKEFFSKLFRKRILFASENELEINTTEFFLCYLRSEALFLFLKPIKRQRDSFKLIIYN